MYMCVYIHVYTRACACICVHLSMWRGGLLFHIPLPLPCSVPYCKEEGGEANWRSWGSSLLLSVVMKVTLPQGHQ